MSVSLTLVQLNCFIVPLSVGTHLAFYQGLQCVELINNSCLCAGTGDHRDVWEGKGSRGGLGRGRPGGLERGRVGGLERGRVGEKPSVGEGMLCSDGDPEQDEGLEEIGDRLGGKLK